MLIHIKDNYVTSRFVVASRSGERNMARNSFKSCSSLDSQDSSLSMI